LFISHDSLDDMIRQKKMPNKKRVGVFKQATL
jgi:hypothetical protein